jgi:crotonobetainyl-CoA:carnitine CoA-transferase CaiB-like acyl-CoA transferase
MENPRLVLVHVSGYGQTGPYRSKAGFGAAAGAMGGLRYLTGYPDRPPVRVGLSIEDSIAALYGAIGALLALYARDARARLGQEVDVSLLESIVSLTEGTIAEFALTGHIREREGAMLAGVAPSNTYQTQDGSWVVIAANATGPFKRLCNVIGPKCLATLSTSDRGSMEASNRPRQRYRRVVEDPVAIRDPQRSGRRGRAMCSYLQRRRSRCGSTSARARGGA